jgi:hypothetical protein
MAASPQVKRMNRYYKGRPLIPDGLVAAPQRAEKFRLL